MILLDKDTVDISNMNRQIMYKLTDVGKPKAETCKTNLIEQHVIAEHTQV